MMVFSSTCASICSTSMQYLPGRHRDLAHLDVPVLGELVPDHLHGTAHHVGLVGRLARSAWRLARQRHLAAMPPSMQASDEPMAEQPTASASRGAFHRSASICTQRRSISAVWGYSSLSIMFLSMARSISLWTSGSSQVWQKVARFWRALPSSSSSSAMAWKASAGTTMFSGKSLEGRVFLRSMSAKTESSSSSRTLSLLCSGIKRSPRLGVAGSVGTVPVRSGHGRLSARRAHGRAGRGLGIR